MFNIGLATRALMGEAYCGDQAGYWQPAEQQLLVCLSDGLGHGKLAYHASRRCLATVEACQHLSLPQILTTCNEELRGTRGVAMALAKFDIEQAKLEFIGVGNITTCITAGTTHRWSSYHGIVGYENKLRAEVHRSPFHFGKHSLFLSSDGVSNTLPYLQYRQVLYPNSQNLAQEILEDWSLDADDASVVVVR